jgi:hypothetical protein
LNIQFIILEISGGLQVVILYLCEFNNIDKYPNPLNSQRHNQEFWICYNKKKYCCLWDSDINIYQRHLNRYPKEIYKKYNYLNIYIFIININDLFLWR